jgi:hypothetical protein
VGGFFLLTNSPDHLITGSPLLRSERSMQPRGLKSLAEVSSRVREKVPPAEVAALLQATFHLRPGSLAASIEGEILVLSSQDKTVRFALDGLECPMLRFLARHGYGQLRRVRWSVA